MPTRHSPDRSLKRYSLLEKRRAPARPGPSPAPLLPGAGLQNNSLLNRAWSIILCCNGIGGLMSRSARFALLILVIAASAEARVISYAPYSDRVATPATQHRLNQHFVLVEQAPTSNPGGALPPAPPF